MYTVRFKVWAEDSPEPAGWYTQVVKIVPRFYTIAILRSIMLKYTVIIIERVRTTIGMRGKGLHVKIQIVQSEEGKPYEKVVLEEIRYIPPTSISKTAVEEMEKRRKEWEEKMEAFKRLKEKLKSTRPMLLYRLYGGG